MNEQRISLTRIIAVNWYGFRQIIEVQNDTLISGAFGTGKSALLDLMQYVLLGEHWRANRAAAGNARGRSLVSYCLCDTNTTRDGEAHYTRSSGVTLAALEFAWPKEKKGQEPRRETWGIRLEFSSPTSEPKRTYFLVPERLEWETIAPQGQMMDEEAFRTFLRREYGRECIFPRQQDYLAEMATPHHLYFDREQLDKTMPKAIAFEPEENVERFIREFILEESPLDVKEVQAAVSAYRETQARLEKQEDEAGYLTRIANQHKIFAEARREQALLHYAGAALNEAEARERRARHAQALGRLRDQFAEDLKQLSQAETDQQQATQLIERVRLEAAGDPEQVKLHDLDRQKRELTATIRELDSAGKDVRERLRDRAEGWARWIRHAQELSLEGVSSAAVIDDNLLVQLQAEAGTERFRALGLLAARFNDIFQTVGDLLGPSRTELKGFEGRAQQLSRELESLEQKRTPGAFPLFEAIQQRFPAAEQLGRLVEVRPEAERWWPVIELLLTPYRNAIIVAQKEYPEALAILRRTPAGREPEWLINPSEVWTTAARSEIKPNLLAAKVEVANEHARAFVNHLLAGIVCAERPEELENTGDARAVTADGFFKDAPARRRLRAGPDTPLTLGREGLSRMRAVREKELAEVSSAAKLIARRIEDVHAWLDQGKKAALGDPSLPDRALEVGDLPTLKRELSVVQETIALLNTPEREARLKQLQEAEQKRLILSEKIGALKTRKTNYDLETRREQDALASAEEDLQSAQLALAEARVRTPAGTLDRDLEAAVARIMGESPKWNERREAARAGALAASQRATEARQNRDAERRSLMQNERHPEYRHDFVPDEEDNSAWDARLRLLEESELPRFRSLAAERRKDWENRLQQQVLDRLNENLRSAERAVRQLREYLDRDIGRHRYRISQRRDPAMSAIWQLLDTGLEPGDPLLQGIKTEEIQRAKAELMEAVEASDKADERARRLLDYRYYHHYDLEMHLAGRDAPPISLGRSGRNLSGGENQAPFFISMLAAFRRVYDLGSARSHHLGLVVMDEAFSKLSGDGVEDCLKLARNFQLQLVIAFPIDRLGVMAPYADTVIVCRKEEERDQSGYVTRVDNIPIILTPDQVEEALA